MLTKSVYCYNILEILQSKISYSDQLFVNVHANTMYDFEIRGGIIKIFSVLLWSSYSAVLMWNLWTCSKVNSYIERTVLCRFFWSRSHKVSYLKRAKQTIISVSWFFALDRFHSVSLRAYQESSYNDIGGSKRCWNRATSQINPTTEDLWKLQSYPLR